MDLKLRLPDDLADDYRAHGPTLESAVLAQLLRFRRIGPADRAVVLAHDDRREIEARLGRGHILSSKDLREKIEKLASLKVGEIEIPFSPAEWQELSHRATKLRIPVETEVRRVVSKMHELFFNY